MNPVRIQRATRETEVDLSLALAGEPGAIRTGLAFFDHMLHQLARHGGLGLAVTARGDLPVDSHHLVEAVGLCLGDALRQALGDRTGIARFGHTYAPLDEALARVVVDLSGRPTCVFQADLPATVMGDGFQTEMVREFFHAFAARGAFTLHADLLRGVNTHHKIECLFKALALALKAALAPGAGGVPSTKGTLTT